MNCSHYVLAASIPDALQALTGCHGRARLIAGGTDLVLQQRKHTWNADVLVDITRLPDLDRIELKDGILSLGCLVTHAQAAESKLVREHLPALAEACATVGSPQIRNVGTLVGNVVTAQPGADGALALHAFETRARVHTPREQRLMALPYLYEGLGQCRVNSCQELISHLEVDLSAGPRLSAFERLSQRRALTLPVINTAVSLLMDQDGKGIAQARVVVGPVASTPFRAKEAERILVGQEPSPELWDRAARSAAQESRPRASLLRGGREYRQAMVEVLVRRALDRALNRRSLR
jgi:CO/xanthine dehydrogenase FAD-binding subunit